MILYNVTGQRQALDECIVARSFHDKFWGLLPYDELPAGKGLLLTHCSSIHTFFMKFAIDCYFLDAGFQVVGIRQNIVPWRLAWPPATRVFHVLETTANPESPLPIRLMDELEVRHA